jgi:outer membrane protein
MRFLPLLLAFSAASSFADSNQAPKRLTVKEAEETALRQNPQVAEAQSVAQASSQVPIELGSAYFPTVSGNVTGAGAPENSRIAAGGLNNPIVYDRFAMGVMVSQLVTDFTRTSNLVQSARFHAKAQDSVAEATRAQTVLRVDRAYYSVLRAQAVLKVAQQTVSARQLVADQADTLAKNKLKSELDVSFANVNLSDSKLLLASAVNQLEAARAELSAAMGYPSLQVFELVDEPMPAEPPASSDELMRQAVDRRPELAALRLEVNSAEKFAKAERALLYPTVSALFTAGTIPAGQSQLSDRWVAAGLNIGIPVFNGKLYSARHNEALYKLEAVRQRQRDVENQISREVRVAWLDSKTAYERVGLTQQMLNQANLAYQLAQSRYELGLSSIVELSQAQLNQTSAEIAGVSARYEYQLQRAVLDFQISERR